MIKVILHGCNGSMGRVIARLAEKSETLTIVAGISQKPNNKAHYPVYSDPLSCHEDADVIIDFSNAQALPSLFHFAKVRGLPVVVATTGLSQEHHAEMRALSAEVPVLYSANMSLGVNLLMDIVKKAARVLENKFDIEIVEKHHNQKIDSPSGTALAIADAINSVLEEKHHYIYERHGKREKRNKHEIGIHSVRGGTIVGDHNVIFAGVEEILEFKHIALSKEIFAQGALKAAEFLLQQPHGMYSMQDVIQVIH